MVGGGGGGRGGLPLTVDGKILAIKFWRLTVNICVIVVIERNCITIFVYATVVTVLMKN